MADRRGSVPGLRRYVPDTLVKAWDEILRLEFQSQSTLRRKWKEDYKFVRNTDKYHGNLGSDFVRLILGRFFVNPMDASVISDDPDEKAKAEELRVICSSVLRVSGLQDALRQAAEAATWAQWGWIETAHPMDPCNLDPVRSYASPRAQPMGLYQDQWVPVPGDLASIFLGDLQGEVPEFDPTEKMFIDDTETPTPLLGNTDYGYPYAVSIDPRYMLIRQEHSKAAVLDYRARLRFLTANEFQALTGRVLPKQCIASSDLMDLFTEVEGHQRELFPEMYCIVDLWISRERNNPQFSNWHLSWVFNNPDYVIFDEPNPYKAYVPYHPVMMNPIRMISDPTIAAEMKPYAQLYDIAMKGMFQNMKDMVNEKWSKPAQGGGDDKDRARWLDENFKGWVNADMAGATKKDVPFKRELLNALIFFRSSAQAGDTSDIDNGIAIKGITARQTEALLTATSMKVDDLKHHLQAAGARALMGCMHLMGIFGMKDRKRKWSVDPGKVVELDIGSYSFATSYIYRIELQDTGNAESNEQLLMFLQFLRQLSTPIGQAMLSFMDVQQLAATAVRLFGLPRNMLQAPGVQAPPAIPGEEGQVSAGAGQLVPTDVASQAYGQHPERDAASRGTGSDVGNLIRGQMSIGMGG